MYKLNRFVLSLFFIIAVIRSADAALTIDITQGIDGALPIAVVPFKWAGTAPTIGSSTSAPEDIAAIVTSDLRRSGRFAPIPKRDLVGRPSHGSEVNYTAWRALGADNLVVGFIKPLADGTYEVQFQLLDMYKAEQIIGYKIRSRRSNLRRTAHQISDLIYKALMGVKGAFDTNISYVTVTENRSGDKIYRLAIADSDGFNEKVIFESRSPIISPSWSPNGLQIAYVRFRDKVGAEVYVQSILTGRAKRVASFKGTASAPAWSPDGKMLALTLYKDGNAEIYLYNLVSGSTIRVTRNMATDTEPVWVPDGSAIIFTSDRGNGPQLYEVAVNSQGARGRPVRLTFEGNYNARASVSPDGKFIAMVHRIEGSYRIAVLERASGYLRVLTESRLDESPSFAPNGSMIIYATEYRNRGVLAAVSVDGRARQRLQLNRGDVREPAWSFFKQK